MFRVGSVGFRVVPARFRVVPAGSGRFRVGSVFYIHPKTINKQQQQRKDPSPETMELRVNKNQ